MMDYRRMLNRFNLDKQAYNAISRNLDRIVSGSTEVLLSPIANENSTESILLGWDKIFNANLSKMNSALLDIESSNRSKFGPRSIAKPWSERRQSVLDYYRPDVKYRPLSGIVSPNWRGRLRPMSAETAVQFLKNSSNSGLPYMVKKSRVKGSIVKDWKSLLSEAYPCMLFTRTQENNKTRNIFGYPIADTLHEMMFYRPILDYQSKLPWRSALRKPIDVDQAMSEVIRFSQNNNVDIVSIDFSAYDASIVASLQQSAFNYFKQLYQPQFWNEIDELFERFNTIELITPDGIMHGSHGVPSGSTFTNEVDSVVQYLISLNCHQSVGPFQIQGDDGVYASSNSEALLSCFESFGLTVNRDKTKISKDFAIYLQSLYHPDYKSRDDNSLIGGVYSTYRAICRIVFMERFDDISKDDISGKDYFAIRTLSILENCRNHPLFEELVRYIISLDKYKLKVSDLGLLQYVKIRSEQEGKDINFRNWQYGEDVKGLKNFYSYKIVEEGI